MRIKKRSNRRIATILSIMILASFICNYTISSAETIPITLYEYNEEFTTRSIPEPFTLQLDCDTISLLGICQGDAVDNLTCYIVDITHSGLYNDSIGFDADGTVWTAYKSFPAGQYLVYFVGNGDIVKTNASMVFSKNI